MRFFEAAQTDDMGSVFKGSQSKMCIRYSIAEVKLSHAELHSTAAPAHVSIMQAHTGCCSIGNGPPYVSWNMSDNERMGQLIYIYESL